MTPEPGSEPPLSTEPVLAWRLWRLARGPSGLTLLALTRPDEWPAQTAMRATCRSHGAPTPRIGCSCGLYAAASPKDLARAGVTAFDATVVGAVAMWGTVVEHARGARAEFAYPARLRLACVTCLSSGRGAVEPAHVIGKAESLVAYCDRHLSPVPPGAVPAAEVQAELLSTYAVDLLPIGRVDKALRRTAPGRPPFTAMRIVELLLTGIVRLLGFAISAVMVLMLFGAALAIAGGLIGGVVTVFHPPSPSPSIRVGLAAPSPDPFGTLPRSDDRLGGFEPHHRVVPPPIPDAGIVCGIQHARAIELVACDTRGEMLLGFAEQTPPKGAQHDCGDAWDAYSRGVGFSVCWIRSASFEDIHPWATSPDPFTVPKEEGGLRDGDR